MKWLFGQTHLSVFIYVYKFVYKASHFILCQNLEVNLFNWLKESQEDCGMSSIGCPCYLVHVIIEGWQLIQEMAKF
jgi:hypothetical protein